MEIDETTGLPAVAEGQYWVVGDASYLWDSGKKVLRVSLCHDVEVKKTRTVEKEEPTGWFWRTKAVTVEEEYTETEREVLGFGTLREYETVTEEALGDLKPGWQYMKATTPDWRSDYRSNMIYAYDVVKPDLYHTWYDHPETPESIRAVAEKVAKQVREREESRSARANLIGVYPPKKLEGSE